MTPEECEAKAKECERRAKRTANRQAADMLLVAARQWRTLAGTRPGALDTPDAGDTSYFAGGIDKPGAK